MASRPWTAEELDLLQEHAPTNNWRFVHQRMRDRTVNAVMVKMSKLRRELGFEDGRVECDRQERFNADAVIASRLLAEATLRLGVWS